MARRTQPLFGWPLLFTLLVLGCGTALGAAPAIPGRQALIQSFGQRPVGTVPLTRASGRTVDYTLEVRRVTAEISPGVRVEQWAFGLPGGAPSVPGPELRAKVGDRVRITLVNTHDQPHTVHLHGITSLAQEMDGVPHTSFVVLPGRSFTYEFVATQAGTFAYHCHQQTNVHLDMGMYGALIIEPREGTKVPWTAEHTLILDEWDSRQDPADLTHDVRPDLFLVNGKTFPLIPGVKVPEGQVDLLRVINLGAAPHSLHLHGNSFLVIAKDGYDLPLPYEADTLPILPGERYDLLVRGRDGAFPFHDHNTVQNVNRGSYPGGQHLMVTGGPAKRADGTLAPAATGHDHSGSTATSAPATAPAPPTTPPAPTTHGHSGTPTTSTSTTAVPAGATVIRIKEFEFMPDELTVKAGTTVTWQNDDPVPHHVVVNVGGKEEVHELPPRGVFSLTFAQAGTYTYRCLPHPFMRGVVDVK